MGRLPEEFILDAARGACDVDKSGLVTGRAKIRQTCRL